MAKRDTVGLPKKRKSNNDETTEDKSSGSLINQLQGQLRDEQSLQRFVLAGTAGVVGLLLVLIVGALIWQYLIIPGQQVATVNGESISVEEFQERIRLERTVLNQRFNLDLGLLIELGQDPNQIIQQEPYATWWQEISPNGQPELLGIRVLNEMIDERIVRAEAEERGVLADSAEVEQQVAQFFNFTLPEDDAATTEEATATNIPTETPTPFVSPTPTSTPAPTNTPSATPTPLDEATEEVVAAEDGPTAVPTSTPRPTATAQPTLTTDEQEARFNERLQSFYNTAQRTADLDEATVRGFFEYQALLAALEEDVTSDVSRETTYVNSRHILVATREEAESVLAALQEGESFAALARAVSVDTGSGSRGGELGWSPANGFVEPFEEAVLDAAIGLVVGPVESEFGFHIIQVSAREEREMTDNEFDQSKARVFNEWLEDTTSDENNDIIRGENWPQYVPLEPQFIYAPIGEPTAEADGQQ